MYNLFLLVNMHIRLAQHITYNEIKNNLDKNVLMLGALGWLSQ